MQNRGRTCWVPCDKRSGSFASPQAMNDSLTVFFHSAFKTASGSSVTDSLLAERGRIDNSHRMADETLE